MLHTKRTSTTKIKERKTDIYSQLLLIDITNYSSLTRQWRQCCQNSGWAYLKQNLKPPYPGEWSNPFVYILWISYF